MIANDTSIPLKRARLDLAGDFTRCQPLLGGNGTIFLTPAARLS